jgi:hypothetical protein
MGRGARRSGSADAIAMEEDEEEASGFGNRARVLENSRAREKQH